MTTGRHRGMGTMAQGTSGIRFGGLAGGVPYSSRDPLLRPCTDCGASPYERCYSRHYSGVEGSYKRYMSRPHPARRQKRQK